MENVTKDGDNQIPMLTVSLIDGEADLATELIAGGYALRAEEQALHETSRELKPETGFTQETGLTAETELPQETEELETSTNNNSSYNSSFERGKMQLMAALQINIQVSVSEGQLSQLCFVLALGSFLQTKRGKKEMLFWAG